MTLPRLIALGHKRRVGKDAAADYLERQHGYTRIGFATALKNAAREIYGFSDDQLYGAAKLEMDSDWGDTPAHILQLLGTECLRKGHRDDVWIRALRRKLRAQPQQHFVIVDCRYPNEAAAVREWGGKLVKVIRPALGLVNDGRDSAHPSETALDDWMDWDTILVNGGTIEDLHKEVETWLSGLCGSSRQSQSAG